MNKSCAICRKVKDVMTEIKGGKMICLDCQQQDVVVPKPSPEVKAEGPKYTLKKSFNKDQTRNELLCVLANELSRIGDLLEHIIVSSPSEGPEVKDENKNNRKK